MIANRVGAGTLISAWLLACGSSEPTLAPAPGDEAGTVLDASTDTFPSAPDVAISSDTGSSEASPLPEASTPADPATLCGGYYDAELAWRKRCGEASRSATREAELRVRAVSECVNRVRAKGNRELSFLASCSSKYGAASSCEEIPCVLPFGTSQGGAACGHDSQCAAAVCNLEFGDVCGQCDDALPKGADCSDGTSCAAPFLCENNRCTETLEAHLGEACGPDGLICAGYMLCDMVKKKCVPSPNKAGQDCINGVCGFGLYCTNQEKCASYRYVGVGEACDEARVCENGSCESGKCKAPTADGAACGAGKAPCDKYAICLNGKCAADDASLCQ